MEFFESVDETMKKGFTVFIDHRLKVHNEAYEQERAKLDFELHRKLEQEFEELLALLEKDKKNLLIDYTDHLYQKYFGIDRWFYERGLTDCRGLYKSLQKCVIHSRIPKNKKVD